jgi:hypothetical protein
MHDNDERQKRRDRELGMDRPITRRDFLNGVAIGIGAAMDRHRCAGAVGRGST